MVELFNRLVAHTHAEIDRHGEAHFACPACGHLSSPRAPHCSFSAQGWHCFVCGAGGSLQNLAVRSGLGEQPYNAPERFQKTDRKPATWLSSAEHLVERYAAHRDSLRRWQAYKPLSAETIKRMHLGVGVLPASRCRHERLIVPIIDGSMVVGLRGRSLGCECGKWLAAGGTTLEMLPLYNAEALQPGDVAVIVENPVDALLIGERTDYTGVAIYSTAYWRDAWLEVLQAKQPALIVVALDNDLPGNGGAARRSEFVHAWRQTHQGLPEARGVKVANVLNRAGLRAVLFDWGKAEHKSDIGNLLAARR